MAFSKANLVRIGEAPIAGGAVQGIFIYNEVATAKATILAAGYFNTVGQDATVGDGTLYTKNIVYVIASDGVVPVFINNDGTDTNDVTVADLETISA